jgi:DNA-binding IclR family transcriptional regulator
VHGLLRTLQGVGFVEQDEESGKYQLGPALLPMGSSYLDGNELRTRAQGIASKLASLTGESVRVGTLHHDQVLILHHVRPRGAARETLEVGNLLPAHATALGKVLMANHGQIPADLAGAYVAGDSGAALRDGRQFREELDQISKRGWASVVGELSPGFASLASPIDDRRGVTVGAIEIAGPMERLCRDRRPRAELVSRVTEAARAVSHELGGAVAT